MPHDANLLLGWVWIMLGMGTGAAIGLFFHRPDWLGGYGTWPRRMVRLGHISFFGTGFLNFMFAFTFPGPAGGDGTLLAVASAAWILGAIAMPAVCFASAWRKPLRNLFFVPVLALLAGGTLTCWVLASRLLAPHGGPA